MKTENTTPQPPAGGAQTDILSEAMRAAKRYYDGSLCVGEDRARREYAYAMGWIHGHAMPDGELTYFVGNANGRGLIRIEVAGTGEHVASMPRGKKSEERAAQITRAVNQRASHLRQIAALRAAIESAVKDLRWTACGSPPNRVHIKTPSEIANELSAALASEDGT